MSVTHIDCRMVPWVGNRPENRKYIREILICLDNYMTGNINNCGNYTFNIIKNNESKNKSGCAEVRGWSPNLNDSKIR